MRKRYKFLAGFGAIVLGLFLLVTIVLLAIPFAPTGYDEVYARHTADIAEQAKINITSHTAPAQTSIPAAPVRPGAPPERPDQRFYRCMQYLAAGRHGPWMKSHPEFQGKINSLISDSWNAMRAYDVGIHLGPPEWESLSRQRGTPEFETALRRKVAEGLKSEFRVENRPSYLLPVADYENNVAIIAQTEPLAEAADLLRLPDGAVPILPQSSMKYPNSDFDVHPPLIQAFLHGALKDPAFDAAAGLRRFHELNRYFSLAYYPGSGGFYSEDLPARTIFMLARSGAAESGKLRAIAGELLKQKETADSWEKANKDKINRHKAVQVRRELEEACEQYFAGVSANINTFHYFLNGKPEKVWMALTRGTVMRQVEAYAVKVAEGADETALEQERVSLRRVLALANIDPQIQIPHEHDRGIQSDLAAGMGLELMLRAWVQDRGKLPENIEELKKAGYLPENYNPGPGAFFWFEPVKSGVVIVQAVIQETAFPDALRTAAQDPAKFKEALQKELPQTRTMPSDDQIEMGRQQMLKEMERHKNMGATVIVQAHEVELGKK